MTFHSRVVRTMQVEAVGRNVKIARGQEISGMMCDARKSQAVMNVDFCAKCNICYVQMVLVMMVVSHHASEVPRVAPSRTLLTSMR